MGAPKRCRVCGSLDISSGRLKIYSYICRKCSKTYVDAWRVRNREQCRVVDAARSARNRKRKSMVELARRHGCSVATLVQLRSSRCIVCNVPPWTHARYHLGPIQVGHLIPGNDSAGYAPMCKKCNIYLGPRRLTAETGREVLRKARRYWSRMQMRNEAWTHTDVDVRGYGFGGVNDSPGRQQKLDSFVEEQRERNEQRERESGRTNSGSDGSSSVRTDDRLVLENPTQLGGTEN